MSDRIRAGTIIQILGRKGVVSNIVDAWAPDWDASRSIFCCRRTGEELPQSIPSPVIALIMEDHTQRCANAGRPYTILIDGAVVGVYLDIHDFEILVSPRQ